jgi:hypothetical protein
MDRKLNKHFRHFWNWFKRRKGWFEFEHFKRANDVNVNRDPGRFDCGSRQFRFSSDCKGGRIIVGWLTGQL